jgi:hypothetical protein
MRYAVVQIARSEAFKSARDFRPWEVPILEQIHGASVAVVGEKDVPKIDWPSAAEEYDRLAQRYGKPEGSEQPYVAIVYGVGLSGLQRAIDEAQAEAESRDAIPYVPVQPISAAGRGYLAAEAKQIEADKAAIKRERAALEAEQAKLAADQAAVAKERTDLETLLETASTPPTPAAPAPAAPARKAPVAKPIDA